MPPVEDTVHALNMALGLKPDLLQQFLGGYIFRLRKRRHQWQFNLDVGDLKRCQ